MRTAGAAAGCLLATMASVTTGFVIPGPSRVVSGRSTRESTSQVIVNGRGDKRSVKGKRFRHSFGVCRPQGKPKAPDVYYEGELVTKPAPSSRRWETIEYDESALLAAQGDGVPGEDGVFTVADAVVPPTPEETTSVEATQAVDEEPAMQVVVDIAQEVTAEEAEQISGSSADVEAAVEEPAPEAE